MATSDLERKVQDFLWFGFVPNFDVAIEECSRIASFLRDSDVEQVPLNDISALGRVWTSAVEESLGAYKTAGLGLSSGLDSRAVYSALVSLLGENAIDSYTFGHPGTEDYDRVLKLVTPIPRNHKMLEVSASKWDLDYFDNLVADRADGVAVGLTAFGTSAPPEIRGIRFTGFMGDSISGKKLGDKLTLDWGQAVSKFVRSNQAYKGSLALLSDAYDPVDSLPASPIDASGLMFFQDQLDWCYRQHQRIRHFVGTTGVATPFTNPSWWKSFALANPAERIGQRGYRRFLYNSYRHNFPDLAAGRESIKKIRSKFQPKSRRIQGHVDLDSLLESNDHFRDFLATSIEHLQNLHLLTWLDWNEIWRAFSEARAHTGRQLYILAALDVNLRHGKFDD